MKKSSLNEMIGPTETEGSLADATRNWDILNATQEILKVAKELTASSDKVLEVHSNLTIVFGTVIIFLSGFLLSKLFHPHTLKGGQNFNH